jgi:Ni,Fe-hydrogenase III small subunit
VCSLQQCRREVQAALHVLYAIERLRFDCMTRPRPRSARVRGLVVVLGPLLSKMSNRTNRALLRHR